MTILGLLACFLFISGFTIQDYASWNYLTIFNNRPKPVVFLSIFITNVFDYKIYIIAVMLLSGAVDYYSGE